MGRTAGESSGDDRIQLDLSAALYRWLVSEASRRSTPVEQIVRQILEQFVHTAAQRAKPDFDITQTRTWQLCGALEVAEPDPEYIAGHDAEGHEVTNYSGHVDDLLYRGSGA